MGKCRWDDPIQATVNGYEDRPWQEHAPKTGSLAGHGAGAFLARWCSANSPSMGEGGAIREAYMMQATPEA